MAARGKTYQQKGRLGVVLAYTAVAASFAIHPLFLLAMDGTDTADTEIPYGEILHYYHRQDLHATPHLYQHPQILLWLTLIPPVAIMSVTILTAVTPWSRGAGDVYSFLLRENKESRMVVRLFVALAACTVTLLVVPTFLSNSTQNGASTGTVELVLIVNTIVSFVAVLICVNIHVAFTNTWASANQTWDRADVNIVFAMAVYAGIVLLRGTASLCHLIQITALKDSTACNREVPVVFSCIFLVSITLVVLPEFIESHTKKHNKADPATSDNLGSSLWVQFCALPSVVCMCCIDATSTASPRMIAFCGIVASGLMVGAVSQSIASFLTESPMYADRLLRASGGDSGVALYQQKNVMGISVQRDAVGSHQNKRH